MATKICRKCNIPKDLDEFYKNHKNIDGHSSVCKDCHKVYGRQYTKTERAKQLQRARFDDFERSAKRAARGVVATALKSGKIVKQVCPCGSFEVEAHHKDYDKPLEVTWLCKSCHWRLHA